VQRQTGRPIAELEGPELPLEVRHIWDWYNELDLGRSSNGFGPNPISYTEIRSWAQLTGRLLRTSETRGIILLDQLFREAWGKAEQGREAFRKARAETAAKQGKR
jgi:hypothetical protein